MKKIIAAIMLGLLVQGCNEIETQSLSNINERQNLLSLGVYSANYGVSVTCDNEKGVEYIIVKRDRGIGITVRFNADGSVVTCEKSNPYK